MRTSRRVRVRFISALAVIAAGTILIEKTTLFSAKKKTILIGPSQSSLIALGRDEQFLVNVNPDSDARKIRNVTIRYRRIFFGPPRQPLVPRFLPALGLAFYFKLEPAK